MAKIYSANQYEDAFLSMRNRNWEVPKETNKRAGSVKRTEIIVDNNGHLVSKHRRESSSGSGFVGTWQMPVRIPGNKIDNPTARDQAAYEKLRDSYSDSRLLLTGHPFNYKPNNVQSVATAESTTKPLPENSAPTFEIDDTKVAPDIALNRGKLNLQIEDKETGLVHDKRCNSVNKIPEPDLSNSPLYAC